MKRNTQYISLRHPVFDLLCGWGIRWGLQLAFAIGFGIGIGIISVWLGTWFAAR